MRSNSAQQAKTNCKPSRAWEISCGITSVRPDSGMREETYLKGIAASHGIAIGPAYCYSLPNLIIPNSAPAAPSEELRRFADAVQQADLELQALHDSLERRTGEKDAAIFEAHQMMLHDPMLAKKVRLAVEGGQTSEQAVAAATNEVADMLAGMDDELFAARATDVRDVGRRVLRI